MNERQESGIITIRNYTGSIVGIIDKFPQFTVINDIGNKELILKNNKKIEENLTFASFAEFEEYMKNRKDGEE
jgi:hypothetical protein